MPEIRANLREVGIIPTSPGSESLDQDSTIIMSGVEPPSPSRWKCDSHVETLPMSHTPQPQVLTLNARDFTPLIPLPQRSETLADVIVSIQNGFDTVIINVLMLKRTSSSSSVSEKNFVFETKQPIKTGIRQQVTVTEVLLYAALQSGTVCLLAYVLLTLLQLFVDS